MRIPPRWGSEDDPEAFESFFRCWNRRLHASVRKRLWFPPDVSREDLVDNITQQAFLATNRAWSSLPPDERAKFLFGAVNTLLPQEARRWRVDRDQRREAHYLLGDLDSEETSDGVGESFEERPDQRWAKCEDLMQMLPPRRRQAVAARLAGLTYKQIAKEMELTEGAVKAHLNFAKRDLKRLIASSGEEEE